MNLLSIHLAREQDLEIRPIPNLLAEGLSGFEISIYRTTVADLDIIDSRGRTKRQSVPFVVAEIKCRSRGKAAEAMTSAELKQPTTVTAARMQCLNKKKQ